MKKLLKRIVDGAFNFVSSSTILFALVGFTFCAYRLYIAEINAFAKVPLILLLALMGMSMHEPRD